MAFRAGCLGRGLPRRPLVLSPQHRLLIAAPELAPAAGGMEALAPAVGLTGLPGVRRMRGKRQVVYIALMLERHEVIEAEGVAVESFYPGPVGLATLSPFELLTLKAAVPGATHGAVPSARPRLDARQARRLADQGLLSGLPDRWRGHSSSDFGIVETGFGTGLNFLLTWQAWRECGQAPRDRRSPAPHGRGFPGAA